jgi:hypothetical protein
MDAWSLNSDMEITEFSWLEEKGRASRGEGSPGDSSSAPYTIIYKLLTIFEFHNHI